jgi:c-di-GMP-binding flagellar brake protein YcgR
MSITDKIVAEILVRDGLVTQSQAEKLAAGAESAGRSLGSYLIHNGVVSRQEMLDILAKVFIGAEPVDTQENALRIVTKDALTAKFDKRIYRRIIERIEVRYQVNQQEITDLAVMMIPEVQYSAETENISAGGLRFVCGHAVPLGTILELKVILENGSGSMDCLAKVCRIDEKMLQKKYHVSVYYLDISSADRAKLNNLIAQRLHSD